MGPFVKRKEIWVPTWRGWLTALLVAGGSLAAVILGAPSFLSPNRPIHAPVLAVEGWMSEHSLEHAIELAKQTNYQLVIVTGGPIEKGTLLSSYETYANLGASRMREMGFPSSNIVAVPCPKVEKDRTYHGALAMKAYLLANTKYREVDLLSTGVHTRRSWLLFKIAGKPDLKIGVIADLDPEFDLRHWWRTSYGVRGVINEMVGYLYAKIVFTPD